MAFPYKKIIPAAVASLVLWTVLLLAGLRTDWLAVLHMDRPVLADRLAERYWDDFARQAVFVDEAAVTHPVNKLLRRLCRANGMDRSKIKLHVVQDDEVNAFAFPGDHLVVYTGLLSFCHGEGELCGVLAHELAHIERGHVARTFVKEVFLSAFTSLLSGYTGVGEAGEVAGMLSSTAYDRAWESEADRLAVDYLGHAGLSAVPFSDFLFRLDEEEDFPAYAEWLSTHPDSDKRARQVRRMAQERNIPSHSRRVLPRGEWEGMQQAVSALQEDGEEQ